jgi:hypothetical protein
MIFLLTFWAYLGSGPFFQHAEKAAVGNCKKYWWSVLIFGSNFVPQAE